MPLPTPENNRAKRDPEEAVLPRGGNEEESLPLPVLPPPAPPVRNVAPPARRPVPDPLPVEDDVFSQLSTDDTLGDDEEEDFYDDTPSPSAPVVRPIERQAEAPPPVQEEPKAPRRRPAKLAELPAQPTDADNPPKVDTKKNFIDRGNKKILPFGGGRTKKVDASVFDTRKNRKQKALAIQISVLAILALILGVGVWNALHKPKGVSEAQVQTLIAQSTQAQAFPLPRGAAVATNFLSAFLAVDSSANGQNPLLQYYYTGTLGGTDSGSTVINVPPGGTLSQKTLTAPQVFQEIPISADSASYVVGALVQTTNGRTNSEKWEFFNVNTYYSIKSNTLSVTEDSPTLVPNFKLGDSSQVPDAKPLGNGQPVSSPPAEITALLYSYFKAYAVSSPGDTTALVPLVTGSSTSVKEGLNGAFELKNDSPSQAIQFTVYADTASSLKVDATVIWQDTSTASAPLTYQGHYLVTLVRNGSGYKVQEISPRRYLPATG